VRHPLRKDRHWFILPCAIACLAALASAAVHLYSNRDLDWRASPLEAIELFLIEFLTLGAAALFGWISIGVARGPSLAAPKTVTSEERGAFFGIAMAAAFFDMVSIRSTILLRDGLAESGIGVGLVLAFTTSLGALLSFGVVLTGWDLLWRRPSRLIMPDSPVLAGARFEAALEIPMPADKAPVVRATLTLTRSDWRSRDPDSSADETTLWSQSVDLREWQIAEARRSRASFHFDLPAGVPCDLGAGGVSYTWQLMARSISEGIRFGGGFSIPTAFEDPIAEGLSAKA
jgi:hypothetical protein